MTMGFQIETLAPLNQTHIPPQEPMQSWPQDRAKTPKKPGPKQKTLFTAVPRGSAWVRMRFRARPCCCPHTASLPGGWHPTAGSAPPGEAAWPVKGRIGKMRLSGDFLRIWTYGSDPQFYYCNQGTVTGCTGRTDTNFAGL